MEWSTTIFNDIHRLRAAHTLTWEAGQLNTQKLNIQRYWQLPRTRPLIFYKQPQEYVEHFSQLFEQAVSELELPTWFNSDKVKQLNLQERYQKMNAELIDYISRYGMANSPFWSNLFEQFDPSYTGVAVKHYYPFFDLRLVNFLVSIPPVPWLVNKNILREAMKGKLPEAIRTRKKIVFEAPDGYTKVMQEMVGSWIGDLLKNTPLLEDYINIT